MRTPILFLALLAAACSGPSGILRLREDSPADDDSFRAGVLHHKVYWERRNTKDDANAIVATNWKKTEELIRMAAGAGAKVVVTPEYSITGSHIKVSERFLTSTRVPPAPTKKPLWLENLDGVDSYLRDLARLSNELKIYIVANALERDKAEGDEDWTYYNSMIAFDPRGRLVAKYRKINLYIYESVIETGGDETAYFDTPYGRFGMLLCFDAIVPWTWNATMVEHEVDYFVVASLWQQTPLPGRLAMNMLANMSGKPVLWANQATGGMGGDAGIIRPHAYDTAMGVWGPEGAIVGNLELPERLRVARLPTPGEPWPDATKRKRRR